MHVAEIAPWYYAWALGVPLIAVNVIVHVGGLLVVQDVVGPVVIRQVGGRGRVSLRGAVGLAVVITCLTMLHALEGAVWGWAYYMVGALPDVRTALLYSIEAMTTYGHEAVDLPAHWQMLGALEALNGMMLFGLTTAFLYSSLQATLFARVEG